ncbi:hypothetical protein HDC30_004637 [Pseudomonas sp. JAI115]|uniref:hypothetical protein n=1 Tax=Pseudomonas sp. JAI115 TaxID=2723061 RepID=UPI00161B1212|nr:hypothetical protein [Pseudomonas sp. JAI115]MBB6157388.1 hypothetical protein [Pseudomonas sp. JAI115]
MNTLPPPSKVAQSEITPTTSSASGVVKLLSTIFDKSTYSGLFKAGTVSIGVYLIGISQTALTLYDKEIDAYTEKYKFEANTQLVLDQTDCRTLSSYRAECLIAQHKIKTSSASLEALKAVTDAAKTASIFCFSFSVFFFLSTPFVSFIRPKENS